MPVAQLLPVAGGLGEPMAQFRPVVGHKEEAPRPQQTPSSQLLEEKSGQIASVAGSYGGVGHGVPLEQRLLPDTHGDHVRAPRRKPPTVGTSGRTGKRAEDGTGSLNKTRLRWTPELHNRFVDVINFLGGPESTRRYI